MLYPRSFAVLILGAGALAAQQQGAQDGVTGAWRLAEVAGKPLPVVAEEGGGCREEILAATLTLDPRGRWTLLASEREVCGGRVEQEEEREAGTYTLQGQALAFTPAPDTASAGGDDDGDSPDDAGSGAAEIEVDEPVSGTVAGAVLTVRLKDGTTAVFRR